MNNHHEKKLLQKKLYNDMILSTLGIYHYDFIFGSTQKISNQLIDIVVLTYIPMIILLSNRCGTLVTFPILLSNDCPTF